MGLALSKIVEVFALSYEHYFNLRTEMRKFAATFFI